tara:strand:+ start:1752 stop:2999 length:1248 start_codon:yes stop_codon:yes gene_type:complete
MSNILANSYDNNSYILLKNVFDPEDIELLIKEYDEYYKINNRSKTDDKAVSQPLTGPVEFHPPIREIIERKTRLFESIGDILGKSFNFFGSETIQVHNDTHGPHRDYLYSHDVLKALICLTGRYDEADCEENIDDVYNVKLDGSFMVLPGSHHIVGRQSYLHQRRTKWPSDDLSQYKELTNFVHFGDLKSNKSYHYPNEDPRGRYVGFDDIPFEKGDVLLFSTRAIHALFPQKKDFMMHFIGMLFIEDFLQGYTKSTGRGERLKDLLTLGIRRKYNDYLSIPLNERVMYKALRPHLEKTNLEYNTNNIQSTDPKSEGYVGYNDIWQAHPSMTNNKFHHGLDLSDKTVKTNFFKVAENLNDQLKKYNQINDLNMTKKIISIVITKKIFITLLGYFKKNTPACIKLPLKKIFYIFKR